MAAPSQDAAELLAARRYLYALGQALLGNEPTAERIEAADAGLICQALEICGLADEDGLAEALALAACDPQGAKSVYTRQFVGPHKLAASPWESVYRTNSKSLFMRETLEVRNSYREQGFLPQGYPRVADDHIALELGFMGQLAQRAAEGVASAALEASARFLDEHLLAWVGSYAEDLAAAAPGTLYASLGCTMARFCARDREILSTLAA